MKSLGILILIFLSMLFVGCAGNHCIEIGGSYQGVDGNLKYCFDLAKSQAAQAPIVSDNAGKEYMGVSTQEAEKIIKMVEDKDGVSVKSSESVFIRLKKLLK